MAGVWSPLTTNWAVTSEWEPRTVAVDSIGHHHAAGTSLSAVLAAAQPGGRDVSMNYVIYRDQIWGVVPENGRAYTSASRQDDNRSITYEIINSSGGPDWSFDPVTLDTVKRLDADIMRRYGVKPVHAMPGFWEHRNLYEWFGRSYPTACAGPSFHIYEVIDGAVYYYNGGAAAEQEEEMYPILWRGTVFTFGKQYVKCEVNYDQAAWVKNLLTPDDKFIPADDGAMTAVCESFGVPWYAVENTMAGKGLSHEGRVWSRELEILDGITKLLGRPLIDSALLAKTIDDAIDASLSEATIDASVKPEDITAIADAVNDEAAERLKS